MNQPHSGEIFVTNKASLNRRNRVAVKQKRELNAKCLNQNLTCKSTQNHDKGIYHVYELIGGEQLR